MWYANGKFNRYLLSTIRWFYSLFLANKKLRCRAKKEPSAKASKGWLDELASGVHSWKSSRSVLCLSHQELTIQSLKKKALSILLSKGYWKFNTGSSQGKTNYLPLGDVLWQIGCKSKLQFQGNRIGGRCSWLWIPRLNLDQMNVDIIEENAGNT